jgi:hypothetical protein
LGGSAFNLIRPHRGGISWPISGLQQKCPKFVALQKIAQKSSWMKARLGPVKRSLEHSSCLLSPARCEGD